MPKMRPGQQKKRHLSTRIDPEDDKGLEIVAKKTGVKKSDVARLAIKTFLEQYLGQEAIEPRKARS